MGSGSAHRRCDPPSDWTSWVPAHNPSGGASTKCRTAMVAGNEQQALSVSGGRPTGTRYLPAIWGAPDPAPGVRQTASVRNEQYALVACSFCGNSQEAQPDGRRVLGGPRGVAICSVGCGYNRGIGSVVNVSASTPLDPFERRDEWRFAVVMVAVVVTGMADHAGGPEPVRRPADRDRRSGPAAGARGRRYIRPPRSC
jgi:hypothetical protein